MQLDYSDRPLILGEKRSVYVFGNGPFFITSSCFVDTPPPPGFRECAECGILKIESGESFEIDAASDFWKRKKGTIMINITDSNGDVEKIDFIVLPDVDPGQNYTEIEM